MLIQNKVKGLNIWITIWME